MDDVIHNTLGAFLGLYTAKKNLRYAVPQILFYSKAIEQMHIKIIQNSVIFSNSVANDRRVL